MTILSESNPDWGMMFRELSEVFKDALGPYLVAIEHVGSTAIKGIQAKPILDIDLVIEDYQVFSEVTRRLELLGYFHNGDQGIATREVFKRKDDAVSWGEYGRLSTINHHLYVCPKSSPELLRHITFRDYLNQHEEARMAYEEIKLDVASRSNEDRKLYAKIKAEEGICTAFVGSIIKKAGI